MDSKMDRQKEKLWYYTKIGGAFFVFQIILSFLLGSFLNNPSISLIYTMNQVMAIPIASIVTVLIVVGFGVNGFIIVKLKHWADKGLKNKSIVTAVCLILAITLVANISDVNAITEGNPKMSGSGYSGKLMADATGFDIGGATADAIMPTGRIAPQHALLTQFTLKNIDSEVYVGSNAKIYVQNMDVMKKCYSTCVDTLDPASHFDTSEMLLGNVVSGASWLVSKSWSLGACGIVELADQSKSACSGYDDKYIDTKLAYDVKSGTTHNPPKISQQALDVSSWGGTAWFNALQIPVGNAIAPNKEANYYWWTVAKTQAKMTPIGNTDYCNTHTLEGSLGSEKEVKEYEEKCQGDHTYSIVVGYSPENLFYSSTITYRVSPPEVDGMVSFIQLLFVGLMTLAGFTASGAGKKV